LINDKVTTTFEEKMEQEKKLLERRIAELESKVSALEEQIG
jgi:hypothetical protein